MATTREQIFAIADELDAAGANPTLAAVRKALGGGSYTTISEVIRDWRLQKATRERPQREPPPPALIEQLTSLGRDLWAQASDLAAGRLATEREALEAARQQLEEEKKEAGELADQLTSEIEGLQQKLAAATEGLQKAELAMEGLRSEATSLRERNATAEARIVEIEKRATDLNAELLRVNEQNAQLVKALASAKSSGSAGKQ